MKPRRLGRKEIYDHPLLTVFEDRVEYPGGMIIDKHACLEFKQPGVGIIVENDKDEILLIEAYRYVTDSVGIEIPAGTTDPGEDFLETAKREALEETGYDTKGHRLLYSFFPSNGISNQIFKVVHCMATQKSGEFDTSEVRSVRWYSREEVKELIRNETIVDGLTLPALLLLLSEWKQATVPEV